MRSLYKHTAAHYYKVLYKLLSSCGGGVVEDNAIVGGVLISVYSDKTETITRHVCVQSFIQISTITNAITNEKIFNEEKLITTKMKGRDNRTKL